MVARINPSSKFTAVLQYNEKKVAQNKAYIIRANGFLQETSRLTPDEKAERFRRLHELNNRSEVNTLHISLNFDPAEKLSDRQMTSIADQYLKGLHLQDQPYLVYRHNDSGHPHLHIITSLIQPDGQRIRTQKMGETLSEPTRKVIEKDFGLVPATKQQRKLTLTGPLQKIDYQSGTATKDKVRQILETVNRDYHYTSLPEYNAVLRQYNILADTGSETSRSKRHGGLFYRMLSDDGKKVGLPMKASSFPEKPTLKNLGEKFETSKVHRDPTLHLIRQKIDWALAQGPSSLHEFAADLSNDQLEIALHQEGNNRYSFTYIDNEYRTAITGKDLGKSYTADDIINGIPGANLGKEQARAQQIGFSFKVPQLLSAIARSEPPDDDQLQIKQKL